MRRLRDECTKKLKNAGWRAFKFGKGLRRAAFKNLPIALRRGATVYRRAARGLGAPKPAVAEDVVVSLTSFPPRIGKLHHVISSLLDQSVQPRKIVLYLELGDFPGRSVPKPLSRLKGDRFEIRFVSENLRPHNKLKFALTDFPGAWIATTDDDRLYSVNWLARLLESAAQSPRTIICTCGHRMGVAHGRLMPFRDWAMDESPRPSFLLFPVGSWGILYPPETLNPAVGDPQLIRKLAPLNDDVWFKAMSLMQNVPCRASGGRHSMPPIHFKQDIRLWDINQRGTLVDEALNNVFGHFGLTAGAILAKEAALQAAPPQPLDAGR
jgi:hypothetical protein